MPASPSSPHSPHLSSFSSILCALLSGIQAPTRHRNGGVNRKNRVPHPRRAPDHRVWQVDSAAVSEDSTRKMTRWEDGGWKTSNELLVGLSRYKDREGDGERVGLRFLALSSENGEEGRMASLLKISIVIQGNCDDGEH
ncbi:hypothetical protein Droror1_Dr00000528 [Drosera rotundifolia]